MSKQTSGGPVSQTADSCGGGRGAWDFWPQRTDWNSNGDAVMNHSFRSMEERFRSIIYPREIDRLRENRWKVGFGKGLKKDLNGGGGGAVPLISVMKFLEGGTMPGIIFGPVPTVLSIGQSAASLSLVGGPSLSIEILSAVPYLFLRSAGNERCRKTLDTG